MFTVSEQVEDIDGFSENPVTRPPPSVRTTPYSPGSSAWERIIIGLLPMSKNLSDASENEISLTESPLATIKSSPAMKSRAGIIPPAVPSGVFSRKYVSFTPRHSPPREFSSISARYPVVTAASVIPASAS